MLILFLLAAMLFGLQTESYCADQTVNHQTMTFSPVPISLPMQPSSRFYHRDADEVDREELQSSEYYNDLNSYRYTLASDRKWQQSMQGIRISAGSLNKTRFFYADSIKFGSNTEAPLFVNISRNTFQDEQIDYLDEIIAIGYRPSSAFDIAVLGSADSYKKWGDMGVQLTFHERNKDALPGLIRLSLWSVDHYYNSKEDLPSDRYDKSPIYGQIDLVSRVKASTSFAARYGRNSSFTWQRYSEQYYYSYGQYDVAFELNHSINDDQQLQFSYSDVNKSESKVWLANNDLSEFGKSLEKRVTHYQLTWKLGSVRTSENATNNDNPDQLLSAGLFERKGNYTYTTPNWNTDALGGIIEPFSFNSKRHEPYFIYTSSKAINKSGSAFFQWGLHANLVTLRDQQDLDKFELKAQTAFEFFLDANASLLVNASWDVDQLANDFPYKQKGFKPWGGGNLQLNMTF